MFDNLVRLILVSVSYIVLIFSLASIMLNPVTKGKSLIDRILIYFVCGNFYVMNIIFILLFLKCTSRIITITVLLVGAFGIRYLWDKIGFKKSFTRRVRTFALLTEGAYGWKFYRKERIYSIWKRTISNGFVFLKSRTIEVLGFLACMVIHAYYMGYRFVKYSGFGIYDESVHLSWIQDMLQGEIYSQDLYPYGLHNIVYAIIKVFDFRAYTVMRYFGFIMMMFMVIMLYILLKKVCRSKYIPFLGLFLYVAADIYHYFAWDRLQYTLTQEYGILFLYPMVIFLYYYLNKKKQADLVLFGISIALTLYVHYYVAFIALFLCLCVGISRFYRIFKEKLFLKLILCGLISCLIGVLPMGIGIATGHGLGGSLYWGIGVITGSIEKDDDNAEELAKVLEEEELNEETDTGIEKQKQDEYAAEQSLTKKVNLAIEIIRLRAVSLVMKSKVLSFLLISMLLVSVNTMIRNLVHRTKEETYQQLSIALYIVTLLILLSTGAIGLPTIIQDYRVSVFLSYGAPILLCMPLELLYELFEDNRGLKVMANVTTVSVLCFVAGYVYAGGHTKELARFSLFQTEGAVEVFYKILDEYDDYQWTIVSPVDEYSMILDSGRHEEWISLLSKMESFNEDTSIPIPTEDIFFYIEKTPIIYGDFVYLSKGMQHYTEFSEEDAKVAISNDFVESPSTYYKKERKTIMAKAFYWAKWYQYYFPNEMTVYYEDDNFICYHLKQEPYCLNNLAIDYGYNTLAGE